MKNLKYILLIIILFPLMTHAQSTEITPGTVLPQMTTATRNALSPAKNGMLVFDINTQSYWYRQSGSWVELLPGGGSGSGYWALSGAAGNEIKNTNTGGFWSASPNPISYINWSRIRSSGAEVKAPISGEGTRLMWIPSMSAFRVGTVLVKPDAWNTANIGLFSFASGVETIASGEVSTAFGHATTASGRSSTAMGDYTIASGQSSTAMGSNTTASGTNSTAVGSSTIASGNSSTAMGLFTIAGGTSSIAMGSYVETNATNSMVYGKYIKLNPTATGSIYLADASRNATEINEMYNKNAFHARFQGGFLFFPTKNSTFPAVVMDSLSNGWQSISDSTKKENFLVANLEEVLNSVGQMRIGTWNYKGQDAKIARHWGVMAQDFHQHFGKDAYGVIGNDTSIGTADFDGVAFAAIKGLEQRTRNLKNENGELKAEIQKLKQKEVQKDELLSSLLSEISLIKQHLGLNAELKSHSED